MSGQRRRMAHALVFGLRHQAHIFRPNSAAIPHSIPTLIAFFLLSIRDQGDRNAPLGGKETLHAIPFAMLSAVHRPNMPQAHSGGGVLCHNAYQAVRDVGFFQVGGFLVGEL